MAAPAGSAPKSDDRSEFASGQPDLDRFFHHYAGQNQFKLGLAVTYVATLSERIRGYATVSAASLVRDALPSERLQRRMPAYPLPVLRLARLAVDRGARGLGIGRALLRHVMNLALSQRETLGCVGLVTDAKPDAVVFYERYGFQALHGVLEGHLHGEPTPMFLGVKAIAEAAGSG